MSRISFFGTLTDFSFSTFVTTRFIKLLYAFLWLLALLNGFAVFLLVSGWGWEGDAMGTLLGIGLGAAAGFGVFLLNLIFGRIFLEILVVVFRIAENTQRMADRSEATNPMSQ